MIKKLLSLVNIFGRKDSFVFISIILFSIISGLLEIVGIGLLAVFALSINDPSIFLEKIFIEEIKNHLIKFGKLELIKFLSIAIILIFLIKHFILFLLYFVNMFQKIVELYYFHNLKLPYLLVDILNFLSI